MHDKQAQPTTPSPTVPPITAETTAADFWDDRYRERDQPWSGNPNTFLVAAIAQRQPGTALELGCGDGGDANWLAGRPSARMRWASATASPSRGTISPRSSRRGASTSSAPSTRTRRWTSRVRGCCSAPPAPWHPAGCS
jgi:hypothetical protein